MATKLDSMKLTETAKHIVREIAAGRGRVFFYSDKPTGWAHVERAGLAVRVPGTDWAKLSDAGLAAVAPIDHEAIMATNQGHRMAAAKIEIEYNRNPWAK